MHGCFSAMVPVAALGTENDRGRSLELPQASRSNGTFAKKLVKKVGRENMMEDVERASGPHRMRLSLSAVMLQWAEGMKSGKSLELRTCRASLIWHLCRKRAGKKLGEIT